MALSLIQKIRLLATLNTLYSKLSALYAQNGGKMSPVKLTQVGSLIAQALEQRQRLLASLALYRLGHQ